MPVVVAVVLASEGRFGAPSGAPVAGRPVATSAPAAGLAAAPAATPAAAGQAPAAAGQAQPGQAAPGQASPGATPAATQAAAAQSTGAQSSAASQTTRPTTGTAPPPAPRTPNSGTGLFRAYSVQPGDTVKFVAEMYGVSPASVAQASGLKNADLLRVGQVLTVPIQPGWLYRVQSGETLDQIAARTGIPSADILSASKLTTDSVGAGDVILIPDQYTVAGK